METSQSLALLTNDNAERIVLGAAGKSREGA